MSLLLAAAVGVLTACGVYLTLRARTFAVVLGLMLLGYAANLFLLAMARPAPGQRPPILDAAGAGPYTNPVPQSLVLTSIVIGFAMSAFALVLAIRARAATGTDHVDGDADGDGGVHDAPNRSTR